MLVTILAYASIWGQPSGRSKTTKETLYKIDCAIWCLRHGDDQSASSLLRSAKDLFDKLDVENFDENLASLLRERFDNVSAAPSEGNCHALRRSVQKATEQVGAPLPAVFAHSPPLVLLISFLSNFIYVWILKSTVDWNRIKQIKRELSEWSRRLKEARRRKDFKEIHKLTQEWSTRLAPLHGELFSSQLRSFLFLPVFAALYFVLASVYSGWIIAWLPFGISLPLWGYWTSCGVLSWLLFTSAATTAFWRKLLIGD